MVNLISEEDSARIKARNAELIGTSPVNRLDREAACAVLGISCDEAFLDEESRDWLNNGGEPPIEAKRLTTIAQAIATSRGRGGFVMQCELATKFTGERSELGGLHVMEWEPDAKP